MALNRFRRGSSTHKCDVCGRLTRETSSIGNKLCPQCYELAGISNEISDGHATIAERRAEVDELIATIKAKGGDVADWETEGEFQGTAAAPELDTQREAARAAGSVSTPAKAKAARVNGSKGGRPRSLLALAERRELSRLVLASKAGYLNAAGEARISGLRALANRRRPA